MTSDYPVPPFVGLFGVPVRSEAVIFTQPLVIKTRMMGLSDSKIISIIGPIMSSRLNTKHACDSGESMIWQRGRRTMAILNGCAGSRSRARWGVPEAESFLSIFIQKSGQKLRI